MVRVSSRCPPGVLCLSPGLLGFGLLVAAVAVFLFIQTQQQQQDPITTVVAAAPRPQPIEIRVESGGGDDRYTRAPKPERDWLARPDYSAMWNSPTALPAIATRGLPEAYQSLGVIKTGDGQVLPLYGRRTASRSDRFQYYTRTDTYNPVQLPVRYKNRDCQDDIGCEELFDGEKVKMAATGEEGVATLYRFSGPTYIPVVA